MIWVLLVLGVLLIVLGVWGGPMQRRRAEKAARIPREATVQEAWDILTSPVQYDDELIKIPEHRPWFLPGSDRRFHRGLLMGFGSGLLVAALLLPIVGGRPAPATPGPGENPGVAAGPGQGEPDPTEPDPAEPDEGVGGPGGEGTDQETEPEAPPEPNPEPATEPANVTITVEMGATSQDIAALLKAAGLIEAEQDFLAAVAELGVETRLQAGTFVIPTDATVQEIVVQLTQ